MVNACVRIDDRDGQPRGTGVLIGARYVVTALHVVGSNLCHGVGDGWVVGATDLLVYEPQTATTVEGWCAHYEPSRDLAVIELRRPLAVPAAPLVVKVNAACLEMFSTVVTAAGFDTSGRPVQMEEIRIHGEPIVDQRDCRVAHGQIVGGLLPGMSGSPLSLTLPGPDVGPAPVIGVVQRGGAGASVSTFRGSDDVVRFLREQDVQLRTIPARNLVSGAAKVRVARRLTKLVSAGFKLAASGTTNVSDALIEYLDTVAKGRR